ncbi:MAG TPA: CaiB/BaiF CoA-transferase family protein [Actinomycetota bacterium]|nr:CaiB/BaiF CoA-transferase family protein [Actinomycetota bacterium]
MGPLTGLRVIELASLAPAPFGCMLLADLGADVLRIERSSGTPGFVPPPGPLDRGRTTLSLDLKHPDGVAALLRLAESADVFVEGFRPGVAERLGIGPEDLMRVNQWLVYARMTGWGQDGPLAQRAGHDINYIALAGLLEPIGRSGRAPHAPMNVLGDFAGGGMLMALGILAALFERSASGRGQVVDAAMVDGASTLTAFMRGMRAAGMWGAPRGQNLLDGGSPFYDTYETSDGQYVAVGCLEPQFFAEMIEILGLAGPDLPGQFDFARWPELRRILSETFAQRTRDEWAETFAGSDACVTPVLSPWEAPEHPHNLARKSFVTVDDIVQPGPAPRFSRSQPAEPVAADAGGRDVRATLSAWGLSESEADTLIAAGTVG